MQSFSLFSFSVLIGGTLLILTFFWLAWEKVRCRKNISRYSAELTVKSENVLKLMSADLDALERVYKDVLLSKMLPQRYFRMGEPLAQTGLNEDQTLLRVPELLGSGHYCLEMPKKKKYYSQQDVDWANHLLQIGQAIEHAKRLRQVGVQEERQRIRRDLHDELTQDLIALIRQADDTQQRKLAQDAMQSLKNILSGLSGEETTLGELLTMVQAQARERLLESDFSLDWYEKQIEDDRAVEPRFASNLLKIFKEASCNILKHNAPTEVKVVIRQVDDVLEIRVENSLVPGKDKFASNRLGVSTMKSRASELGGYLEVSTQEGRFILQMVLPILNDGEQHV
ncbi:MAG: hypothetical protein R3219_08625 [Hydrogenovibrio sp.]|nr:hypothetical protein [Hydrogenovibrio sp.]